MFKHALGAASLALSVYAESEHMETMQRFFGDFTNAFLVEHAPVETQEVGKYLFKKIKTTDQNCHESSKLTHTIVSICPRHSIHHPIDHI